jgi:hypothetical protein
MCKFRTWGTVPRTDVKSRIEKQCESFREAIQHEVTNSHNSRYRLQMLLTVAALLYVLL